MTKTHKMISIDTDLLNSINKIENFSAFVEEAILEKTEASNNLHIIKETLEKESEKLAEIEKQTPYVDKIKHEAQLKIISELETKYNFLLGLEVQKEQSKLQYEKNQKIKKEKEQKEKLLLLLEKTKNFHLLIMETEDIEKIQEEMLNASIGHKYDKLPDSVGECELMPIGKVQIKQLRKYLYENLKEVKE